MRTKIVGIFLLGTALVQGNITLSNSPNSPYRKLSDLTENVTVLNQKLQNVQRMDIKLNEIFQKISENEKQHAAAYDLLKTQNEKLASELENFKRLYDNSAETFSKATQQNLLSSENKILKSKINSLEEKIKALENNNNLSKFESVDKLESNVGLLQHEVTDIRTKLNDIPGELETNLAKIRSENKVSPESLKTIDTQLDKLKRKYSSIKNKTNELTLSRENMEKYLQEFYAEINDKLNNLEKGKEYTTEENMEDLKEIKQRIDTFLEKYQKIDTFNDILLSFQNDLSQLKDSIFELSIAQENIIKNSSDGTNSDTKLNEFKKDIIKQCENICKQTIHQTNENLQNIAQQVQIKMDSLKARSFSKHIILSGESLSSIAKRYSTSPEQILLTNNIKSARDLRVGDTIIVPNNL